MKLTDQIELKFVNDFFAKSKKIVDANPWLDYILSPIIVAIILFSVYAIKGVYPFGLNTISYYDMPASFIPIYSFSWDALHGYGGVYLNWYCGLALSMADIVGNFLFFPTNLFFLFVSRENILYTMSLFLLIKLMLCSFSMSLYLKKNNNDTIVVLCSGIVYAFSGFILQYYTNIYFLDLVFLFPIIVYSFERLLIDHKFILFTILLFFSFFLNIQLVFMMCLYLVFKGYFVIHKFPIDKQKKSIRYFALSVFIALALASFILFPSVLQTLQSTRNEFNSRYNYFSEMKDVYSLFRRQKQFMLYGSEFSIALILIMFIKEKTNIIKYSDHLIILFILCIPILHEGINELWHLGSYKHFPMRFAYIMTFEMLSFVGDYLKENDIVVNKRIAKIAKIIGISIIPFIAYVLFGFTSQFVIKGTNDRSPFMSYNIYFLTLVFAFFVIFLIDSSITRDIALISIILIQAFCGAYGFIAPHIADYGSERTNFTLNSINLFEKTQDNTEFVSRTKSNPAEYESNYAMTARRPAISSWLYGLSANTETEVRNKMGYDGVTSYLMDSGGTIFTDALLGVTNYASSENPNLLLYKDSKIKGVYNSIYTIPFGCIPNGEINDSGTYYEHSNNLFASFTGLKEKLISQKEISSYIVNKKKLSNKEAEKINTLLGSENDNEDEMLESNDIKDGADESSTDIDEILLEYSISIPVSGSNVLYLYANEKFNKNVRLLLNGTPIPIESFESMNEFVYPNYLRNGIIELGSFEDEKVNLLLYTTANELKNLQLGFLDLKLLDKGLKKLKNSQNLITHFSKNGMEISGETNKDGLLFLPIGFSENWKATLNGKKVNVIPCINDAFISVEVPKGEINLNFTYFPKGLLGGILISIFGCVFFAFVIVYEKHDHVSGKAAIIIDRILLYTYKTVFWILIIFMYIIPIYIKMSL